MIHKENVETHLINNTKITDLQKLLLPISKSLENVYQEINYAINDNLNNDIEIPLINNSGKRIRAVLLLLSNGLFNGASNNVSKLAASLEILHEATLIHDDIIDNAELRRGKPAISTKYGNKIAVLTGDYYVNRALTIIYNLNRNDILNCFIKVTNDMILGEFYQLKKYNLVEYNIENYYKVIELKTASFFAICAKLAAILNNQSSSIRDSLYNFGLKFGYAYQIKDDLLDYTGEKGRIGKNPGNDLKNKKITLPVILLYNKLNNKEKIKLKKVINQDSTKHRKWLVTKIKEFNIDVECNNIAKDYIDKANHSLESFPESNYKTMLQELSYFVLNREN